MRSYEETIRNVHSKISMYEAEKRRKRAEIAGTAAAVIPVCAIAAGAVFLLRNDGLTEQSSSPEALIQEAAAEPVQTAPAVTARPEKTTAISVQTEAETSAVTESAAETASAETAPAGTASAETASAETAPAGTASAKTIPAKTTPAVTAAAGITPAETKPADTAPAVPASVQQVYEPGDVDMDGKITYADAALVFIDVQLASYDRMDLSLLSEEQRALGDVDGHTGCWNHWYWDEEKQDYAADGSVFPLNHAGYTEPDQKPGDDETIFHVACYRKFLELSDLTAAEYLADPAHYDAMYEAWCRNTDAESLQQATDMTLFYWQLRQALCKTKHPDSDTWTGSFRQWLEKSVYLDDDILYDAEWFRENAEIMRSYF